MLEVKKVQKRFRSGDNWVTPVNNLSLTIPQGTFVAIIGRSGAGKSTLLSLLGALDKPTEGTIVVDNTVITDLSDHELTRYRCNDIGFVFQQYNLVPNLSALENVMLPMEFAGVGKSERESRAEALLQSVGLDEDKQQRRPARLSGGEQQRVSIARALANKPKLILADEPTGNLDSETGKNIFDLLHTLSRSENTTIIAVTHDLSIAGKTDKTYKLNDGKLTS